MTKDLNEYLNNDKDSKELIWKFAFLGKEESLNLKLNELADLAEPENWTTTNSPKPYDILNTYISYMFSKAFELGKEYLLVNNDETYSCFNTGLLTPNGEDIICMFNQFESSNEYHWHLCGFKKESDWLFLENFNCTPKVPHFFENPADKYFNPNKEIIKNMDHILDDNFDRFEQVLQEKGKASLSSLLNTALELTIRKCKRNYRIAVPQYYKNKITYLLPVNLDGILMALAVENINDRYRVNTIFTLDMAYKSARVLMKPEVDWLTEATKK